MQLSSTIHASFNEFQPVYMTFYRTITPRQRQSCKHSRFILLDTFGKRLELWQHTLFYQAEPSIQLLSCTLSDHLHESLCQTVSGLCAWTGLSHECQFFLLCLVQLI